MNDVLKNKGWEMYYECQSCGWKQYYKHKDFPGYEITVRPRQNTSSIFKNSQMIDGPFWIYELEKKMAANGL